jgi:hypothetical protein
MLIVTNRMANQTSLYNIRKLNVNYEKIKTITGIALMAIFGFTSCQSEVDDVQGENPNTNAANSTTAIT